MAFFSEPKQFFIDTFSSPVYQNGVLYFIIEELLNPNIKTLIRYARLFDLYLSYDSEIAEMLNNLHIRSEYQSHVASSSDFYPIPEITKDIDVLFYGSWSPWREEVLFAAYQATSNIALFGSDWLKNVPCFHIRN